MDKLLAHIVIVNLDASPKRQKISPTTRLPSVPAVSFPINFDKLDSDVLKEFVDDPKRVYAHLMAATKTSDDQVQGKKRES